ncbi:hypothetical protein LCGC14_0365080 [marine sediment metagenome]|uniref:Uncharacterized protein n=1 Tax=marine sediment metagenome TaxID=412755 RepID=A0A0F9VU72_9ZZZZ
MKEFINLLKTEKCRKGRTEWKYKDVTIKQKAILLRKKINEDDINELDRGTARLLIAKIFEEELQIAPYKSITNSLENCD